MSRSSVTKWSTRSVGDDRAVGEDVQRVERQLAERREEAGQRLPDRIAPDDRLERDVVVHRVVAEEVDERIDVALGDLSQKSVTTSSGVGAAIVLPQGL